MFILVIVVVFFLTSLAGSLWVVYDAVANKDKKTEQANIESQLQETLQSQQADQTDQSQQSQANQSQKKEGALEGTKLANFSPIDNVDSLQVQDIVVGTGKEATASSTITAHYTGAIAKDGTIFQSSKDSGQPFTSALSGLIQGWQEGIPGMKEGGTRRLIIPAEKAYGNQATGNIPANSNLVFDIELITVQ
jgi:FKBP-type peptidyl-prolyl cis-trans isomerase FkpA